MFVFDTGGLTNPRFIINFPTKRHWRGKSRIEDIESGLSALTNVIKERNIQSIAIPPLGSGLGGLEWSQVRSKIEETLKGLHDVRVIIFEPKGAPETDKMVHNREVPKMTAGRASLVELMRRYLGGLLDPFVTLLEVHKLMYFMQAAGEPLKLKYKKGLYGPYAENLRHVLNAIEGHFELLSTVHWVVSNEQNHSVDDVVANVYAWNDRKKQFTRRQIKLSLEILTRKGWVVSS
jgi:O-acetyl-ADP-ribose deacetylase (regulator of RNase III)